ncbi:hypothetical protein MHBO_004788 [Bonamia ostreae]|uniref:Uncharacterized protein n=1 Tax=Bonamia ostreae TaxID=126728 RepID=A0ABV2AV28_9EUKA
MKISNNLFKEIPYTKNIISQKITILKSNVYIPKTKRRIMKRTPMIEVSKKLFMEISKNLFIKIPIKMVVENAHKSKNLLRTESDVNNVQQYEEKNQMLIIKKRTIPV